MERIQEVMKKSLASSKCTYADYLENVVWRKEWHLTPLLLCKTKDAERK